LTGAETRPVFFLPDQDLFLALSFEPLCAEGRPLLHLILAGSGSTEPLAVAALHESGTVMLGDLRLEMDVAYRPVLRLAKRPGAALALSGFLVSLLAIVIGWLAPARLVWVSAGPGSDRATLISLQAAAWSGENWLRRLGARLQEALDDAA
jgi:hypothetical protein